jgi:hypothetical protein
MSTPNEAIAAAERFYDEYHIRFSHPIWSRDDYIRALGEYIQSAIKRERESRAAAIRLHFDEVESAVRQGKPAQPEIVMDMPTEFLGHPLSYWVELDAAAKTKGIESLPTRVAELEWENRLLRESRTAQPQKWGGEGCCIHLPDGAIVCVGNGSTASTLRSYHNK